MDGRVLAVMENKKRETIRVRGERGVKSGQVRSMDLKVEIRLYLKIWKGTGDINDVRGGTNIWRKKD